LIYLFRVQIPGRFEAAAYLLLVLGAAGDWVSTSIGLRGGLAEGNALAVALMSCGRWVSVDLTLVAILMVVPYVVNKAIKNKAARALWVFPVLAGLLKVAVCLWNINLII
jgi:hypothetical protein